MNESDTAYCVRMLRHGALGALVAGPIAVALALAFGERLGESVATRTGREPAVIAAILAAAALLVGVWIGATISCGLSRYTTAEDTCYGGFLGCSIYLIGGIIGAVIGRALPALKWDPLIWYLIGGTAAEAVVLALVILLPATRHGLEDYQ